LSSARSRPGCWSDSRPSSASVYRVEAPHTGALVAVDTFFVGTLKSVGKLYLQTAIDCHSRYAWAKLYPSKLPVTAVHLMNNEVIPTFETHGADIETSTRNSVSRGVAPGSKPSRRRRRRVAQLP
jgi:hypothetical protein